MKVRFTVLLSIICLHFTSAIYANSNEAIVRMYIVQYKTTAVQEMHRAGIPASIKMAQGILESDAGRSELATEANNHFGMKCGVSWEGPGYYKKDDDRDRRGRLIKSCFRVYNSSSESYYAHSEFLLDPAKAYRYAPLFDIEMTDYRSWAWGLRKAGYATNRNYANLLIKIIEKYELYSLDYQETVGIAYSNPRDRIVQPYEIKKLSKKIKKEVDTKVSAPEAKDDHTKWAKVKINGVNMVLAQAGNTVVNIANRFDVPVEKIIGYNEDRYDLNYQFKGGEPVFLQRKRKRYSGKEEYHTVEEKQSLFEIAQKYGLRMSTLYYKNRLEEGQEPLEGEKIKLKGRPLRGDEIPMTYRDLNEFKAKNMVTENTKQPVIKPLDAKERLSIHKSYHTVEVGDTFYGIARLYNVTVEDLKAWNSKVKKLSVGQKIVVGLE